MPTQLEEILAQTTLVVRERKASADFLSLERRAAAHAPRGFESALRQAARSGVAVITELKKASPSRGLIREDFHPEVLARLLEDAGAAALSVLTNEEYFQGSHRYLEQASSAVSIPCLCKDFFVDSFQLLEARAAGADAVLLIVAAMDDARLRALYAEARGMGLDVLCEVHDRDEAARAVNLGFNVIGVNSRNLHTMEVRPQTQVDLSQYLPTSAVRVAESGIRDSSDVARLLDAGYDAFLVGESLMRQADPGAALATLLQREYTSNA